MKLKKIEIMGNKSKTKNRKFEIPKEMVSPFINQLEETELFYELKEVDEDGDLIINVKYSDSQKEDIMDLIELLDEYYSDEEETEEEQENN